MDAYAIDLKASHEAWKDQLGQAKPGSDPRQIASEALELAMQDLRERLPSASPSGRGGAAFPRRGDELHPPTFAARVRPARGQPLLPMFGQPPRHAATASARPPCRIPPAIPFLLRLRPRRGLPPRRYSRSRPPQPDKRLSQMMIFQKGEPSVSPVAAGTGRHDAAGGLKPGLASVCSLAKGPGCRGLATPGGDRIMEETDTTTAPPAIASGEKAKARDIIAAIRTLQQSSGSTARPLADERQILARFGGFGAVALSLFPDPVTGRYKDAGWQALGDELKSLLTPEEYDSRQTHDLQRSSTPRRSSSQAMHEALRRLGVPDNATVLEPGCGTGNFMSHAPAGHAVHRRRDGFASPAASPAPCTPKHDIRIESFRDTQLPEQRRRRDRQPAVRRRAARLSRPEAAAA